MSTDLMHTAMPSWTCLQICRPPCERWSPLSTVSWTDHYDSLFLVSLFLGIPRLYCIMLAVALALWSVSSLVFSGHNCGLYIHHLIFTGCFPSIYTGNIVTIFFHYQSLLDLCTCLSVCHQVLVRESHKTGEWEGSCI